MDSSLPKANVLLVDDKPEQLLALETVLEELDQNLIRASSAREALKFLLLEDVALILLDVQMPGLDGFQLAELIRERERTQHTPIIFVTADIDNEAHRFKGYSLGAVDYLTKPVDPEVLKSKVGFFSRLYLQQEQIKTQARELETANSRLDALNIDLEQRVRLRTLELERANSELEVEVKERRQSEARLATEHAVTRTLAAADTLAEAIPAVLNTFIENLGAAVAAMWETVPGGSVLRCSHIQVAPNERPATTAFVAETRAHAFPIGSGFPGHVWNIGSPVWIPNTLHGEQFPRARIAATIGLHSAVGFPISIGAEFFGVMEFFTREPLHPSEALTGMLEAIASEIAQFIQKKRIEDEREKLLQREKALRGDAETANRLKDEFLATVSHELRTPLNSILGWSQVVLLEDKVDENVRSALEVINRNALSQAQLIEDLLDASRLISGKLALELGPTHVIPVLEAAVESVRPAAEGKGLELETSFDQIDNPITCDANRLQQMVWNLVTNAVKFTPAGGRVSVGFEVRDGHLDIAVSDTGVGISQEFLPFVFDRFRQQDSSSTRRHHGLGLGLAIVKHLAELHGGSVSVTSEGPGLGSAFTIRMPATGTVAAPELLPEDGDHERPVAEAMHLDGVKILVVDDDVDTCHMLKFALRQHGASVETVTCASEALRALAEEHPEVLIADINMPDEDGYSLIRRVRRLPDDRLSAIPAVAVTALSRAEDTERALSAGFQMHLPKPIDISELVDSIRRLSSRSPGLGNIPQIVPN
ncbi:MAG TPA: response regulator [Pyrinomonadaceae bacterium]|nr:response regulator [Pyrinomonadaceae bacterium]